MEYMTYIYKWNGRDLKKIINAVLKSWTANEIQKLNYGQIFSLNEKKVEKSEMKLLLIKTEDKDKLTDFLLKNYSQIQKINIC